MKKCCFIIPYFGKLPNYFQLFLNSCATNKNYDWLLLTDDSSNYIYPTNVTRVLTSFENIVQLFSQKLGMQVALPKPYKLCDYKPAYGFLFSEYITDYQFWGHGDIDTIMGDLDAFITDDLLEKFDKIFCLGHLILYRNTTEVNRAFMTDGHYRHIYTHPEYKRFDEVPITEDKITIDQLIEKNHLKIFKDSFLMDVYVYDTLFRRVKYECSNDQFVLEKTKKALYVWQNGKVLRYYINANKELTKEEFIYIHLQKREMKMLIDPKMETTSFKIVPNAFMELKYEPVTIKNIKREKKIHVDGPMLKLLMTKLFIHIVGFIYALYKGINPFKVEIVQYHYIKWNPHIWQWIRYVPK